MRAAAAEAEALDQQLKDQSSGMWARAIVVPVFIKARRGEHPGGSTRPLIGDWSYRVHLPAGSLGLFRTPSVPAGSTPCIQQVGPSRAGDRPALWSTRLGAGRAILSWRSHDTTSGLTCRCTGRHRGARARAPRARVYAGLARAPVNGGSLGRANHERAG